VIGRHSIIAAQTGISGSTRVGEHVTIAGQVGIVGHVTIGDGTVLAAQSGISKDIPGGVWFGLSGGAAARSQTTSRVGASAGKLFDRVKAIEKKLGL